MVDVENLAGVCSVPGLQALLELFFGEQEGGGIAGLIEAVRRLIPVAAEQKRFVAGDSGSFGVEGVMRQDDAVGLPA